MNPKLSVVVPSYNEQKNLKREVLAEIVEYLKKQNYSWEVVLSDDGSTDGTAQALDEFAHQHSGVKVLHNPHRGKAPTVTSGMMGAKGEWRLFTDFDQSTSLKEIEKLWPYIDKGFDVVIGSREMMGARRDKEPFHRHLMGRVFNIAVQVLAVPGVLDTQCGFKMFSVGATQDLFPKLRIYGGQKQRKDAFTGAFDVELLFLALKHNYQVREVPIFWNHRQTDRVSPVKDSIRMFRDIVKIRLASVRGFYQ
ncbi:MAG: dolichyl-phosphate beta-glucosyltransferase [Patescibacteria group bacterium]|nr:glycosyltransferase family 2 protein [Patescibacteria group bacterium]